VKRDLHLLAANFRSQMSETSNADVLFLVGNKKFKAHKFVLEARCPLFMKHAAAKPSAANPNITVRYAGWYLLPLFAYYRCYIGNCSGYHSSGFQTLFRVHLWRTNTSSRQFCCTSEQIPYEISLTCIPTKLHDLELLASKAHMLSLEDHCSMHAIYKMDPFALCAELTKQYPTPPASHSDEMPKYEACLAALGCHAQVIFSADPNKVLTVAFLA